MIKKLKISGNIEPCLTVGGEVGKPSGGTNDYEALINKPKINDVTLTGNKTFEELGLRSVTNTEISEIIKSVFK